MSSDEDTRIPRDDEETAIAGHLAHGAPAAPIEPLDLDLERTRIASHGDDLEEHTILRGRRVGAPAPVVSAEGRAGYRAPSVEPGGRVAYGVNDRDLPVEVARVHLSAPTERSTLSASPEQLRAAAAAKAKRRATALVIGLAVSIVAIAGAIVLVFALLNGGETPANP